MMAKVPPPRGKGDPPIADATIGNLDKPESEGLVALNFKVTKAFRKALKLYAAEQDQDMVQILFEAVALHRASRS